LFDAAHEATELGNLLGLLPHVSAEKHDENDQADGQRFKMSGKGSNGIPGDNGKNNGENQKDEEGEDPKLLLPFFKLLET
jgi:hypothetical protein